MSVPAGGRSVVGRADPSEERSGAGHVDPPGAVAWVMQLVLRVEKVQPPSRAALCEAAAIAVVRLLADQRSAPGGDWAPAVGRWTQGRIRKHARRARGAAWQRAQAVDGLTVEHAGAAVRAFVPTGMDAVPHEVGRLQLSGSEVDQVGPTLVEPIAAGPVVVSITAEPWIPLGKAAAAAGHAAQLAWLGLPPERRQAWARIGYDVTVEHPAPDRWRMLRRQAPVRVLDGGLTVVPAGTCTAVARWR